MFFLHRSGETASLGVTVEGSLRENIKPDCFSALEEREERRNSRGNAEGSHSKLGNPLVPLPAPSAPPIPLSRHRASLVVSSVFIQPAVSNRASIQALVAPPLTQIWPRLPHPPGVSDVLGTGQTGQTGEDAPAGRFAGGPPSQLLERIHPRLRVQQRFSPPPPLGPGGPAETETHVDG